MRALEMMKKIRHPNLLSIHGAGEHDKHLIIILELAERTLGDRLKELTVQGKKGLPVEELLNALEDAAKGIDYLNEPRHELGEHRGQSIQHRDIKPHNLLVVGNTVKVGDFGLAKMLTKSVGGHSGAMSVAYAAPEFFNDQTSNTSDQYSLAVTYCQLRGGRTPFTGSEAKIMMGHMREPPDLNMLPVEQERRVVEKALAKNPKERYASCTEFVKVLRQSLQPEAYEPQAPFSRPRKKASGALVGFLLFLMLCLVGAFIFLLVLAFKSKQ
jgi:serine/threonine protein kinase